MMPEVAISVEFGHVYLDEIMSTDPEIRARACGDVASSLRLLNIAVAGQAVGSFSTCVLVDDYSARTEFVLDDVLQFFESAIPGDRPHHIFLESDFTAVAPELIEELGRGPGRLNDSESGLFYLPAATPGVEHGFVTMAGQGDPGSLFDGEYLPEVGSGLRLTSSARPDAEGSTVRYSCQCLAACWALCRLGHDPFQSIQPVSSGGGAPTARGHDIMSILKTVESHEGDSPRSNLGVEASVIQLLGDTRWRDSAGHMSYWFFPPPEPKIRF